jgi:hypothetical protein
LDFGDQEEFALELLIFGTVQKLREGRFTLEGDNVNLP